MPDDFEFGRKILFKRMMASLENAGYRVETAPDYDGFIVADRREDPNILLLHWKTIEQLRDEYPGNPSAFIAAILKHVKGNLSPDTGSVPPPAGHQSEQPVAQYVASGPLPLRAAAHQEANSDLISTGEYISPEYREAPGEDEEAQQNDEVEEISGIIDDEDLKNQ